MDAHARSLLLIALAVLAAAFAWKFGQALSALRSAGDARLRPVQGVLGVSLVATFFDTLGIGSFAPTTSLFRQLKLVPDEKIPGTLNVGYVVPTFLQAFIYTRLVPVDATTLFLMISASALGAWVGAGFVSTWPRRRIQMGMGIALIIAAVIMCLSQPQVRLLPTGGTSLGLHGIRLAVGVAGNFFLGALMTLGVGLYAPCMILIYLLGMSPAAAFPIMMGSCAFLMPVASFRFIRSGSYSPSAAIGMSLTGIPAVLIAAYLIKSLPLSQLRWLVIVAVTYAGFGLIRAYSRRVSQ